MTEPIAESAFEVEASPAEAWKALEELRVRAGGPDEWWVPGFECRGAEIEVDREQQLTVRKIDQPCADTLIAITFEHVGTGSRIRVVQSGFDAAFIDAVGDAFWTHAHHLLADTHLFFATGVVAERAWLPWTPLGLRVHQEPYGLRVRGVQHGTWAERVGLQDDDVVLTVAGGPVYAASELALVERIVRPGGEVDVTWARGRERFEATATA